MRRSGVHDAAASLRRVFDQTFAEPLRSPVGEREKLLALEVSGVSVAVRLAETGGVLRCPPLTTLPSRHPALVGLARVRGSLIVVYDLCALMKEKPTHRPSRWVLLAAGDARIAFRFDELLGYENASAEQFVVQTEADMRHKEVVRVGAHQRIVVGVNDLLQEVRRAGARE